MKIGRWILLGLALVGSTGCVLTKVITVPMRVVGAVASIVPVAGDTAHDVVDEAAEKVDKLPF
ncbi:MAG TPA: DUF6726 family protein [Candidatus Methylomirabilis sp.]|jgi:hypothetical protein|nr:DUF6726 family protein [Candidatus Methylomirabilis sp.]